jgi:hypothetical protein
MGEYYKISTKRGLGYNYSNAAFWNTSNVSGTERRVSRLLGSAMQTAVTWRPPISL